MESTIGTDARSAGLSSPWLVAVVDGTGYRPSATAPKVLIIIKGVSHDRFLPPRVRRRTDGLRVALRQFHRRRMGAAVGWRVLREPDAGDGSGVLRDPEVHRGRHRQGARRRARRGDRMGQDRRRRAGGHSEQDRRPHRGEPRIARARRGVGQRQADPRDAGRRPAAGRRPLPLFRGRHPRTGGLAVARSTRTPSPITSTSRWASSGRSSRGTSRS